MDPAEGPGLMFVTLPIAFAELPWGALWLSLFFLLLLLATWTSSINLAEPMVANLQGRGMRRGRAAAGVGVSVWPMGLLPACSFSYLSESRPPFKMTAAELLTTITRATLSSLGDKQL